MKDFYKNKRIFITGNTGFKGTWLSNLLLFFGADICGYSDKPSALFQQSNMNEIYETVYGDIRDYDKLSKSMKRYNPDIVLHLAAQPLVMEGYHNPRETFDVNVMGTVNFLSSLTLCKNVKSAVTITTDKVYKNFERVKPYKEEDSLGGTDPYSASKSCADIATSCFLESFDYGCRIGIARAGNVIGGGDFAENRIIPDCISAAESGKPITIRNPESVRPWQHVLEPLRGYLMLAAFLYENETKESAFNFGPELRDCITVETLVDLFCEAWGENTSKLVEIREIDRPKQNKESKLLMLDSSKAKELLKWDNRWNVNEAIRRTVEWHKGIQEGERADRISVNQIKAYVN